MGGGKRGTPQTPGINLGVNRATSRQFSNSSWVQAVAVGGKVEGKNREVWKRGNPKIPWEQGSLIPCTFLACFGRVDQGKPKKVQKPIGCLLVLPKFQLSLEGLNDLPGLQGSPFFVLRRALAHVSAETPHVYEFRISQQ